MQTTAMCHVTTLLIIKTAIKDIKLNYTLAFAKVNFDTLLNFDINNNKGNPA